jgi:hypothetical protein
VLVRPNPPLPQLDPTSLCIHAEISGSDRCTALGLDVRANAPVLMLCRLLVEAGHDPTLRLEAYRGDVLCLSVRSIGEAAELEINGDGTGFRRRRAPDAAPPIEYSAPPPIGRHPTGEDAPSAAGSDPVETAIPADLSIPNFLKRPLPESTS